MPCLLQSLAYDGTVVDGGKEADKVDQAGDTMHSPKSLVKSSHLLGVGRWVVALLPIASF